jgi:nitrogen fixation NifU-like protein
VPDPDIESHELNPFCGDEVTLQIKLDGEGRVAAVRSVSQGCSIVQSSASMMAELMEGKTLEQLMGLSRRFRSFMQGDPVEEGKVAGLGDLEALQVVRQYPVRIKCVLLPWLALEEGIEQASSDDGRQGIY